MYHRSTVWYFKVTGFLRETHYLFFILYFANSIVFRKAWLHDHTISKRPCKKNCDRVKSWYLEVPREWLFTSNYQKFNCQHYNFCSLIFGKILNKILSHLIAFNCQKSSISTHFTRNILCLPCSVQNTILCVVLNFFSHPAFSMQHTTFNKRAKSIAFPFSIFLLGGIF